MALSEEVAGFADEIRQVGEGIETELETFPSGAVSLFVRASGHCFHFDYLPSDQMFGVDELQADDAFDSGYRFGFHDFDSARAKLWDLLREARTNPIPDPRSLPR